MTRELLESLRARLLPVGPSALPPEGFRRAAVLVPLLQAPGGLELLFTVRSSRLPHHAGQIAFPGGAIEGDEDPEQAARREALEEVGMEVPPSAVLGRLQDLPSPAMYLATPVVASLPPSASWRPQPEEVEEVFTVPLVELQATDPETEVRMFRGRPRRLYRFRWHDRDIWGFTGNVVRDLLERMAPVGARP